MSRHSRAVAPVISTILMVAIVIILSATISIFVLDVGETVRDPAPVVAQSTGELIAQDGTDGGTIRITHQGGDSVSVNEIEIVIDASDAQECGQRERLINLPESGTFSGRFADTNVASGDISNSIVDGGFNADLGVLDSRTDNEFSAGSFFEVRLTGGECPLKQGDKVVVQVIHVPTNSVIIKQNLLV